MDCGFKMRYTQETHDYPKRGKVKYISYMCGSYARSGKGACSAHNIYLNSLSELVLGDIRHRAKRVLEDEGKVRQESALGWGVITVCMFTLLEEKNHLLSWVIWGIALQLIFFSLKNSPSLIYSY